MNHTVRKINLAMCKKDWEHGTGLGVAILNGVMRSVLTEVSFVNRLEADKGKSHMTWRKNNLRREYSECKGPGAGLPCLVRNISARVTRAV